MRRRLVGLVTGVVMFAVLGLLVLNGPASAAPGDGGTSFFAYVNGQQEVPPTVTDVTGTASFRVREDGQALEYTLAIYGIQNVTMGHIHLGSVGVAGPIVLTLIPMQKASTGLQNITMSGSATAAQLEGPLKGQPLSALTSQMAFNTYVNFHTSNGSATPGEGNYPGGEVRGNIMSSDAARVGTQPALPAAVNVAPAGPTVQPFGPANNVAPIGVPFTPNSAFAPAATAVVAPAATGGVTGQPAAPATGTQPLGGGPLTPSNTGLPGVPNGQPGAQGGNSSIQSGAPNGGGAASGAPLTGGSGSTNTNPGAGGSGTTGTGPNTGNTNIGAGQGFPAGGPTGANTGSITGNPGNGAGTISTGANTGGTTGGSTGPVRTTP